MSRTKGEESKRKLLQAAEELFAKKGFQSTKISEIVANAGLTQAAFYLYFKSKEDIFQQMIQDFDQQLIDLSDAGKKAVEFFPNDIKSYVTNMFIQLFTVLGKNPNLTRIALQHATESDQIRKKIVEQIANNMSNNQRFGIVKEEIDTWVAAEAIVAVTERLVNRYLLTGEKTEKELGEQVAQMFLNGILNHSKSGD
ncbi:TetR family transcriptional regulator [Parageobacillus genomosp. 1]|uniref:TetR family transcriptional regulator n=1 Tax=Parageobacillus genomosp. 1 TaxID=1295642 RepID=A0ABC9VFA2_9BACL|nr:TetR/AcrR family transcriptional regulator [Parageobacillus genomosp. 1]EZP77277.1 TetR family transcriptional regulator [Parageobacillus genomosp. 1]